MLESIVLKRLDQETVNLNELPYEQSLRSFT